MNAWLPVVGWLKFFLCGKSLVTRGYTIASTEYYFKVVSYCTVKNFDGKKVMFLKHWRKSFGESKACLYFLVHDSSELRNYEILYIERVLHRALEITADPAQDLY